MSADIVFVVPGKAVGKGRPRSSILRGRGGKPILSAGQPIIHHHTPENTANYENLVKVSAMPAMQGRALLEGAVETEITVFIEPPKSWSKKKTEQALSGLIRPTKKPDIDNLIKAIYDALNGVVWVDDSQVTDTTVRKRYSATPRAFVKVKAYEPLLDW